MEKKITFTLKRVDADALVKCLQRRHERLCDIKQEICEQVKLRKFTQPGDAG